jgi:hypothetical protein
MIKPGDLNRKQREMFDTWRSLGLSESAAMDALREDGLVAMSDHDRLVANFVSLGLSASEAETAAHGRGPRLARGTTTRSPGVTVAETLQDNRQRLIENIERIAQQIRWSGSTLCVWNGESREQASLREAYYEAFRLAPDDATKLWVIGVVQSRWPGLRDTGPGATASSSKPASVWGSASTPVRG